MIKKLALIGLPLALMATACSPNDKDNSQQKGASASPVELKTCLRNGTNETYYFGISQKSFGSMTSQLEPKSGVCVNVQDKPEIFVRTEKKGENLCSSIVAAGGSYRLTKFNPEGDCDWAHSID